MRDKSIPMCIFIKEHKSILNVSATSTIKKVIGREFVMMVLERYLRIYKTPCYRVDYVFLKKFQDRYRCRSEFIDQLFYLFRPCIGFAVITNGINTSTESAKAAGYAREKYERIKKKKFNSLDEQDIYYFNLEIKGVQSEIRFRR